MISPNKRYRIALLGKKLLEHVESVERAFSIDIEEVSQSVSMEGTLNTLRDVSGKTSMAGGKHPTAFEVFMYCWERTHPEEAKTFNEIREQARKMEDRLDDLVGSQYLEESKA